MIKHKKTLIRMHYKTIVGVLATVGAVELQGVDSKLGSLWYQYYQDYVHDFYWQHKP